MSNIARYWELPNDFRAELPAFVRIALSTTLLGNLGFNAQGAAAAEVSELRRQVQSDFDLSAMTWLKQVHGKAAVRAESASDEAHADASFTQQKQHACAVLTADCLPVLLASHDGATVAAVHAGWRGLSAGVIENTVAHSGLKDGVAFIAPAIGPCCFEVGEDVRAAFLHGARLDQREQVERCFTHAGAGKFLADLPKLAEQRLRELGFRVLDSQICTRCDARFYSHRASVAGLRADGRFASMIWREASTDRRI